MPERDAAWAVQQYEAVRSLLPIAKMPEQSCMQRSGRLQIALTSFF